MIISAIGCAFSGLCYAEFAAMVPAAGSAYTYATVGELFAWIIGWDLILEYALSTATVAVGWSGYFVSLARDLGIIAFSIPTICDVVRVAGWRMRVGRRRARSERVTNGQRDDLRLLPAFFFSLPRSCFPVLLPFSCDLLLRPGMWTSMPHS